MKKPASRWLFFARLGMLPGKVLAEARRCGARWEKEGWKKAVLDTSKSGTTLYYLCDLGDTAPPREPFAAYI